MRFMLALALALLATLAHAGARPAEPIPESEWAERTLQSAALIKSRMLDEDSAKFRILKQTKTQVCGEVNGKTSLAVTSDTNPLHTILTRKRISGFWLMQSTRAKT